jgi:hypothetical protein
MLSCDCEVGVKTEIFPSDDDRRLVICVVLGLAVYTWRHRGADARVWENGIEMPIGLLRILLAGNVFNR